MNPFVISGFSDEICDDFRSQLEAVKEIGMTHICIRSANGKNICDHTADEVKSQLLPLLEEYGIKVSSIGSPIGKVFINDDAAVEAQLDAARRMVEVAQILSCKYIRVFSFYLPKGDSPAIWRDKVMKYMTAIAKIFEDGGIIGIHENEKDLYGENVENCLDVLNTVNSKHLRAAFDFANFAQCKVDVLDAYDKLKDHIAYFHVKDYSPETDMAVLCGTGIGKIAEILKMAYADGFSGFLTLEPHLVAFGTLKTLELVSVDEIIKEELYSDGRTAFTAQCRALENIVSQITA